MSRADTDELLNLTRDACRRAVREAIREAIAKGADDSQLLAVLSVMGSMMVAGNAVIIEFCSSRDLGSVMDNMIAGIDVFLPAFRENAENFKDLGDLMAAKPEVSA